MLLETDETLDEVGKLVKEGRERLTEFKDLERRRKARVKSR